jgi:pilus assembly protein Flp/PilA
MTIHFLQALRDLARDQRGATAIEYAIIAGSISIVILVAAQGIGSSLNSTFTTVKSAFPS